MRYNNIPNTFSFYIILDEHTGLNTVLLIPRIVANALDTVFTKGDAIAIDMPMTCTAVIIYLAIILAGYVVVSIADSFAPKEIGTRVDISKSKGIFTQVNFFTTVFDQCFH